MTRADAGSTHVLEAVVVLCIMFGAIASVANFQVSRSSVDAIEKMLDQMARDQLAIWQDTPLATPGRCTGTSDLDQLIYEGLDGNHTRWDAVATRKYEPNLEADLVIDNRAGVYPIHGSGKIVGSGARTWWAPELDYASGLPSVDTVSGSEKLVVDVPAVHWADKTRLLGEAVRIRATYNTTSDESRVETWTPTAVLDRPPYESRSFAGTISWADSTGSSLAHIDVSPSKVSEIDPTKTSLFVHLNDAASNGQDFGIPANTTLTVAFPQAWLGAGWKNLPSPWVNESPTDGPLAATTLVATARGELSPSSVLPITVFAPTTPSRPFDIINAQLSNGSLGSSDLVVTFPGSVERGLPRVFAPTMPYPVRNDAWTLMGGAFANGGDEVRVTRVDVEIPGGYDATHNEGKGAPLFAAVDNDASFPAYGWTLLDARHVRWESAEGTLIPAGKADQWIASVRITPDASAATAIEPVYSNGPSATLRFSNGFNITSREWGHSPGIIRLRVPPASEPRVAGAGGSMDGYPWSRDALAPAETFRIESDGIMSHLRNASTYKVRPAGGETVSTDAAAANASISLSGRIATLGSTVVLHADVENLMTELARAGVRSSTWVELYAPPSLGCKPTASWRIPSATLPAAPVTATLVWNAGSPVDSVFAATNDGNVFRLDAAGTPLRSFATAGTPLILAPMDSVVGDAHLLVGTASGKLQRIRASDALPTWSATVSASASTPGIKPTVVRYDAVHDRILAANQRGEVVMFTPYGEKQFVWDALEPVLDAQVTGPDVFVLTASRLHRLNATLVPTQSVAYAGRALALGAGIVIVGESTHARVLDTATLSLVRTLPYSTEARVEAHGDATGDGIDDLVIGHAGSTLTAISGATGMVAYTKLLEAANPYPPPWNPLTTFDDTQFDFDECSPVADPSVYATRYTCTPNMGQGPIALWAGAGRASAVYYSQAEVALEQVSAEGSTLWLNYDDVKQNTGSALHAGTWSVGGGALAYGDQSGRIVAFEDEQGSTIFHSTPSERVGRFNFLLHVPSGSFFGTHLVVVRLSYQTGDLESEARLVDWFDVVDSGAAPVARPAYAVGLTLRERDGSG